MPNYIVNIKTRTLHIEGLCHHLRPGINPSNIAKFSSEEDASRHFEGNLKHCKTCWGKRDAR